MIMDEPGKIIPFQILTKSLVRIQHMRVVFNRNQRTEYSLFSNAAA